MKLPLKKIILIFLCIVIRVTPSWSQIDSLAKKITWSSYLEMYHTFVSPRANTHTMPSFVYSFNRANELNINLAMVKANFKDKNTRASIGFMAGTYTNANLATEPGVLKNIYEANMGVKLSKKHNLWLDAGVLPSHIGFESPRGIDGWTLTQSILADNSPYYETGAKITYISPNEHWLISALALNGWQNIHKSDGNNSLSFGHQVTYTGTHWTINSSSFIGNTSQDAKRSMRYYHDLYSRIQLNDHLGLTAGFDIGMQQSPDNAKKYYFWYAPIALIKYQLNNKWNIAARMEKYHDTNNVIVQSPKGTGFQVIGTSCNIDYQISKQVCWRIEAQKVQSKEAIFTLNEKASKYYYRFTTALSISL